MAYPENQLHVRSMPRVTQMMREETPRMSIVLFWENDAHAAAVGPVAYVSTAGHPVSPQHAEEQRTSAAHDSNVGQKPVAIVVLDVVDHVVEKRMIRHSAHSIVGNSRRQSLAHPSRVREQRFELTVAAVVQVEVNTAVVLEDKVPNGVGALDGVRVVPESILEPLVLVVDEFQAHLVGPQLVFPVWVEVDA